ncbi:MAG: PadR family transcriptional regulator [Candidatus Thorarchaeota archaeon]
MTEKANEKFVSHNPLEPLPIVRVLFLGFIKRHPNSTGYDLMRLISEFTKGLIELKSGTTYSELRRLESQKLVESTQEKDGRKRRSYTITSSGERELSHLADQMKVRVESILEPLLSLID